MTHEWPTHISAPEYAEQFLHWHPVTARKAFWAMDEEGFILVCDACGNWESAHKMPTESVPVDTSEDQA